MYKRNKRLAFQKLLTSCIIMCLLSFGLLNTAFSNTQLPTGAGDDIIKIEVIGDELVGLNALTNIRVVEKLKEGELVTSALAKGKVGAVLTNRRLLGFNAANNAWSSFETFFNKDVFPTEIKVSSNMAVAIAKRRVYAYTSTSNKWEFELISFLEQTLSSDINENIIFIRTNVKLLAFSFHKNKWFPQNLYEGETIKNTAIGENFVTVATDNKIPTFDNRKLTFDAKNGKWTEERLSSGAEQQTTDISVPSGLQAETVPDDKSTEPEVPDSES